MVFSEQESQAVYLLKQQNISRLDIVNFISHGISKTASDDGQEMAQEGDDEVAAGAESAGDSPLENYATNLNAKAKEDGKWEYPFR